VPNTGTVRATLSSGAVTCTVRRDEPLTTDEWDIVRQLSDAVLAAATALERDGEAR
jgi:hypothetical protein